MSEFEQENFENNSLDQSVENEKEKIFKQLIELTNVAQPERYFQSQGELLCKFCRKPGHLFRNCLEKETQCLRCKSDHDPMRCPLGNVCFWCFNLGHNKADCKKLRESKYCQLCKISSHSTQDCQKVWRDYLLEKDPPVTLITRKSSYSRPIPLTSDNQKFDSKKYEYHSAKPNEILYVSCYYCGSSSHFGDFCNKRRFGFATAFDVDDKEIQILEEKLHKLNRKDQGKRLNNSKEKGWAGKKKGRSYHSPFAAKMKRQKERR